MTDFSTYNQQNSLSEGEVYSADYILCTALNIGEEILRCGGEPHRIEDTVTRICTSCGALDVEVFALPSVIIASIHLPDGTHASQVRRLYQTQNNMFILEKMNDLSRRVCSGCVELCKVDSEIEEIKKKKPFPTIISYIGAILGAGGFAIFFGGSVYDALAAAIAGVVVTLINLHKASFVNQMVHTLLVSFVGAVTALSLTRLGLGDNPDMIMIGTIMLLIPGLSFGNAVRDMLFGDTVSGLIQLVQAVLLAATVAFGFALSIMLFGGAKL